MNGGRLSDDETFFLGLGELRRQLQAPEPDRAATERALTRIAVRYPEEAEEMRAAWAEGAGEACRPMLAAVEARHRAESEDE